MKHWKWIASTSLVAVLAIAYATAESPRKLSGVQNRTNPGSPLGLVLQLFDADKNGEITRGELSQGEAGFDALDANKDGVLSAADFPRPRRSLRVGHTLGARIAKAADADESGDTTELEWRNLVATIETDAGGVIVPQSLHQVLGIDRPMVDGFTGANRPAQTAGDLNALFSKLDRDSNGTLRQDELIPNRRGPRDRAERRGPDGMRGPGPRGPMSMADTDESGDISADEWQAEFNRLDQNGDGTLSKDEMRPEFRKQR